MKILTIFGLLGAALGVCRAQETQQKVNELIVQPNSTRTAPGSVQFQQLDGLRTVSLAAPNSGITVPANPTIINPGFESGISSWSTSGAVTLTAATSPFHSGSHSGSVAATGTGGAYQTITGLPIGQSYLVSAWVNAGAGTVLRASIAVDDSTGGGAVASAYYFGTGWSQLSATFTVNSTAAMTIHLNVQGTGTKTYYFDDIAAISQGPMYRLPPKDGQPGQAILTDGQQNLSFGPNGGANSMTVSATNPLLLYFHFRDDNVGGFADYSRDYLNYRPVSVKSLINQTNVRDTSIRWDGTNFWIIASAEGKTPCKVQIYSTPDLIHFSARSNIDMSPFFSGCTNAVSPEWGNGKPGTDPVGFWVTLGDSCATTCSAPFYATYDPAINGLTPTAVNRVTVNGTLYASLHAGVMNIFDQFPYYDAGSNAYYLQYVDWNGTQFIQYAKSSTLLGTYTQQTTSSTDHFHFSAAGNAEGTSIIPLADSVTRYGIAGCVRNYSDTWFLTWGAGPPSAPNIGNRSYHWKYIDTCPATVGTDPFVVLQPMEMLVDATFTQAPSGTSHRKVQWQSGPDFSTLTVGQTLSIDGNTYTIASIDKPDTLTLTSDLTEELTNAPVQVPGYAQEVMIPHGEQGTVIALADSVSAGKVYQAEDYWREEGLNPSRITIGGRIKGEFPLTVWSNYAHYNLSHDESATIAAGGHDSAAAYNAYSYALWSACGVDLYSCPQPSAGEASWIQRYSGFNPSIILDHQNADTGETSIAFQNGTQIYGSAVEGQAGITSGSLGNKTFWRLGTNNQFFGPMAGNGNVANNWFYIYNSGLGAHTTAGGLANPGFETGSLSSWSISGSASAVSGGQFCNPNCAHSGTYSAALTAGTTINQTVSGLTPNTLYEVTAWAQSSTGSTSGVKLTVSIGGSGANPITQQCNNSLGCIAQFSWYQIGLQYTTDGTGSLNIKLLQPFGSGTAHVDDIDIYPLESTLGAFPFAVSPSSGEVRVNYLLTLGNGDNSNVSQFPSISIDSPNLGNMNIGSGRRGDRDANVFTGTLDLQSAHAPAFDDTFATARLEYAGGAAINNIGPGIVFAQQYDSTLPGTLTVTGGINGYKTAIDGVTGGGLAFYTRATSSGTMTKAATLDNLGVFASLNGYYTGPLGSPYGGIFSPSAGIISFGNGSSGNSTAQINIGNINMANNLAVIEPTTASGNELLLGFNTQNVGGTYFGNVTGNRASYLKMGNAGIDLVAAVGSPAGGTQTTGVPLSGVVNVLHTDNSGNTKMNGNVYMPGPDVDSSNKLEVIGDSGHSFGNVTFVAKSAGGVTTYFGAADTGGSEGVIGTYTNHVFAIRQFNNDRIVLPTAGGVVVTGNLNVNSGIFQINGNNGVSSPITCNTATIQYKDWSGSNQSAILCTGIGSHTFSGGIKTF